MNESDEYANVRPMIYKFAWEWKMKSPVALEDIVSECNLIFCIACREFDETKNTEFSSYFHIALETKLKTFIKRQLKLLKRYSPNVENGFFEKAIHDNSELNENTARIDVDWFMSGLNKRERQLVDIWLIDKRIREITEIVGGQEHNIRREISAIFDKMRGMTKVRNPIFT